MSNVIDLCLTNIMHTIPIELLERAFRPARYETLDELIQIEVIRGRVLKDCNLLGGRIKLIVLESAWVEVADTPAPFIWGNSKSYCLYRVPPEARDYRPISQVIELRYPYTIHDGLQVPNAGIGLSGGMNTLGGLACQMLAAQTGSTQMPLPTPILRAGDIVALSPNSVSALQDINWVLVCRINYDDEFTNINQQAIPVLINMVEAATKAYIYNTLIIKTDQAFLDAGQQLGKLREICESYSDQNEKYKELLRPFNGASTILDPEMRRRRIRDMI